MTDWMNDFAVGEDVLVGGGGVSGFLHKGQVQKINKKSLSLKLYQYTMIADDEAKKNQTEGSIRLVWGDLIPYTYMVYRRADVYKRSQGYAKYFAEGKRYVDYRPRKDDFELLQMRRIAPK